MHFREKLQQAWDKQDSLVCLGLDPLLEKIPSHLKNETHPLFSFNKQIIDATQDLVCAYKPQMAYYSSQEAEDQLLMTIEYIQKSYPQVVVILDSKRGDIADTAEQYAKEAFDRYRADAVTVNPYMGTDSLTPFLSRRDKGVIVLCRTSNPGSLDFQLFCNQEGLPLYQYVAKLAQEQWNEYQNIALVVGATQPQELQVLRQMSDEFIFLVPGIGFQGGDLKESVQKGMNRAKQGLILNSTRALIYASNGLDFAQKSREATLKLRSEINKIRRL